MKPWQFFSTSSPEFVVLHSLERQKKGKGPTVSWEKFLNPREALIVARNEVEKKTEFQAIFPVVGMKAFRQILDTFNCRPVTMRELLVRIEEAGDVLTAGTTFVRLR